MAFEPGVQSAAGAGYPVRSEPYPLGEPGIRKSVQKVAEFGRKGAEDPDVRRFARDALVAAGLDGRDKPTVKVQAQAILTAIQTATIYMPDPAGTEYIASAAATLCLRPGLCIGGGDCDDLTIATLASMLSVGLNAHAVKVRYRDSGKGEPQQHILVGVIDEKGHALYADPSTRRPISELVSGPVVEEVWIDPLEQVGSIGTAGATLVTLGSPFAAGRDLYFKGKHWWEFRYGRWWVFHAGRWVKGPEEQRASGWPVGLGFNLINDWHSIGETQDLYNALTYQVGQITSAFTAAKSSWSSADSSGESSWEASYNSALTAWNTLAGEVNTYLTTVKANASLEDLADFAPAFMATTTYTGDPFKGLADAFKPFIELDRQLRAASAKGSYPAANLPTYSATPQPQTPDVSLAAYQIADSAAQKIEQVATKAQKVAVQTAPWVALGLAVVGAVYVTNVILPRLPVAKRR